MSFVRAASTTMHYRLSGAPNAPVVLFANSLGTSLPLWDAIADRLAPHYRVLRYDKRGHGLTDAPAGPYSISQLAGDAAALLDVLGIARAHFCGISIGGMIGQQFAADYGDRLRGLILCDTGMRIGTAEEWQQRIDTVRSGGVEALADAVLQRWFTERFFRERAAELAGYRNMLVRTPAAGYAGACAAIQEADLEPAARSIVAPTLVVVGEADPSTPPAMARELQAAITGARLETIAEAAHIPCVEQADTLADLLLEFLRGVDGG